jgi:hypothetical protein
MQTMGSRKAMRQKYHIFKKDEKNELIIQEYAVVDGRPKRGDLPKIHEENFALLCEQIYDAGAIKSSISSGKESLILLLRNSHFFPIHPYIQKIADTVISLYASKDKESMVLVFDDTDLLIPDADEPDHMNQLEQDDKSTSDGVEDLLNNDINVNTSASDAKKANNDSKGTKKKT